MELPNIPGVIIPDDKDICYTWVGTNAQCSICGNFYMTRPRRKNEKEYICLKCRRKEMEEWKE